MLAAGCRKGPRASPPIGEAYVGPAVLNIRGDIPLQSATVATVKHGERLEILQRRRRFLKVRTPGGAEGWTDERQLLAHEEMAELKALFERARKMPVQGQAKPTADLNMHTQPSRQSPSFLQVKENEPVDVLSSVVTGRTEAPRKPLLPPAQKKSKDTVKKPAKSASKYAPPPLKPPGPPDDWIELSKTDLGDGAAQTEEEAPAAKPVPTDRWSLIRASSGESGWVLTSRLIMAIPDEVAQYAEGRRIVSYFPLGAVQDGDQKKTVWLWTTSGRGGEPCDFDSFRVFVWSLRHHRYETAYIERNLKGYSPVLLKDVMFGTSSRSKAQAASRFPGFSVCMENKDGQRYRREYAFLGIAVRYAGEQPCEASPPDMVKTPAPGSVAGAPAGPPAETFAERFRKRLHAITRGWFRK